IAHTGYLELFDLVVKHILPGMGLFFHFVLHFNCKFAGYKKGYLKGTRTGSLARKAPTAHGVFVLSSYCTTL
ncbi:hypothetical protein ACTVPR_09110, partial [Limosilactobacillus fermentum]